MGVCASSARVLVGQVVGGGRWPATGCSSLPSVLPITPLLRLLRSALCTLRRRGEDWRGAGRPVPYRVHGRCRVPGAGAGAAGELITYQRYPAGRVSRAEGSGDRGQKPDCNINILPYCHKKLSYDTAIVLLKLYHTTPYHTITNVLLYHIVRHIVLRCHILSWFYVYLR